MNPSPLAIAIALDLYGYNVSAEERAAALHQFFNGECADMPELVYWCEKERLTAMPLPTMAAYLLQALERYGKEAQERAEYLHLELKHLPTSCNRLELLRLALPTPGATEPPSLDSPG